MNMAENEQPTRKNETEAIRQIQTFLRQLSYFEAQIPAPEVNGIFVEATRDSLMAFQRLEGLPVTGVADQRTFELLYHRYRESLAANAAPVALSLFPRYPAAHSLGPGDEGFLVDAVQFLLREIGIRYAGYDNLSQSGNYDAETDRAVRALQERYLLPETGRVDKNTWNALAESYNRLSENEKDQ